MLIRVSVLRVAIEFCVRDTCEPCGWSATVPSNQLASMPCICRNTFRERASVRPTPDALRAMIAHRSGMPHLSSDRRRRLLVIVGQKPSSSHPQKRRIANPSQRPRLPTSERFSGCSRDAPYYSWRRPVKFENGSAKKTRRKKTRCSNRLKSTSNRHGCCYFCKL